MIGFIDSGVGGLTIFKKCIKIYKKHSFIYFADNLHAPFGQLNKETLKEIMKNNVNVLIGLGCKIIVLACNTATATSINFLRETFSDMIFVGTEPNILAPLKKEYKDILVLGTKATIDNSQLLQKYKWNLKLRYYPALNLASIIEKNLSDKKALNKEVNIELKEIKSEVKKSDAIVLGCTHYPIIKKNIEYVFDCKNIFTSTEGVIKNLKRKISTLKLPKEKNRTIKIILSDYNEKEFYKITNYINTH